MDLSMVNSKEQDNNGTVCIQADEIKSSFNPLTRQPQILLSDAISSSRYCKTDGVDQNLDDCPPNAGTRETKKSLLCSLPLEKVEAMLSKYTSFKSAGNRMKSTRKILCLYCDRTFVNVNLRQKHVERCHSSKQLRRVSLRNHQNLLTSTPCSHCDKFTSSEQTLQDLFKHLVENHSDKYFGCLTCEIRFLNSSHLADHNIAQHNVVTNEKSATSEALDPSDDLVTDEQSHVEDGIVARFTRKRLGGRKTGREGLNRESKIKSANIRSVRNKRLCVKASRVILKRSKRLQAKLGSSSKKHSKVISDKNKIETNEIVSVKQNEKSTKTVTNLANPYPEFDHFYRVKKITDHSIDNLKISSLTFDDVFDKAFFNRIKCNIQENLLHHIDGKLFKNEESESRISNFEKNCNVSQEPQCINTDSYGCELSINAVAPTTLLLSQQLGDDPESQIEYGSKPSKKKTQTNKDEVHYKYFTRRKYQASILERKENRDLSKLDMWTQYVIKNRQQKIVDDKKTPEEIIEYYSGEEYKNIMRREELNRILDRRGPFEDLKVEASKKAALDKLNGEHNLVEDHMAEVEELLNEMLNKVFELSKEIAVVASSTSVSQIGEEMPSYLNLRPTMSLSVENEIDRSDRIALICSSQETEDFEHPNNKREKNEKVELTGEWARSRIYICAACGRKLQNIKQFLEHKSSSHQYIWVQHYEFVGNQSELYTHLTIPVLGKVGHMESTPQCKIWKRSDARLCSKCGKQCNSLGELHRHILECGGDWTWMLARKKCKYRPFGAKSRRKRRGLYKRIYTQKAEPSEKKTYKKPFGLPKSKPSDADSIKRMLANLPPKRITRKVISLKDGFPRQKKNSTQVKLKCGKLIRGKKKQQNVRAKNAGKASKSQNVTNRRSLRCLNKVLTTRMTETNSFIARKKYTSKANGKEDRQNNKESKSKLSKKEFSRKSNFKQDDDNNHEVKTKRNSPRIEKRLEGSANVNKTIKRFFSVRKKSVSIVDNAKDGQAETNTSEEMEEVKNDNNENASSRKRKMNHKQLETVRTKKTKLKKKLKHHRNVKNEVHPPAGEIEKNDEGNHHETASFFHNGETEIKNEFENVLTDNCEIKEPFEQIVTNKVEEVSVVTSSASELPKRKLRKRPKGLNDCIAMLTSKLVKSFGELTTNSVFNNNDESMSRVVEESKAVESTSNSSECASVNEHRPQTNVKEEAAIEHVVEIDIGFVAQESSNLDQDDIVENMEVEPTVDTLDSITDSEDEIPLSNLCKDEQTEQLVLSSEYEDRRFCINLEKEALLNEHYNSESNCEKTTAQLEDTFVLSENGDDTHEETEDVNETECDHSEDKDDDILTPEKRANLTAEDETLTVLNINEEPEVDGKENSTLASETSRKRKLKNKQTTARSRRSRTAKVEHSTKENVDLQEVKTARKALRNAKTKALESMLDDALLELSENELLLQDNLKNVIATDLEPPSNVEDKIGIESNNSCEVMENETREDGFQSEAVCPTEEQNLSVQDSELNDDLKDADNVKELRRSSRNSRRVTSYNETDLVDPLLDDIESNKTISRIIKETTRDIFGIKRKNRKKANKIELEANLNGDELFDLLKTTPNENMVLSKPTNTFFNTFDEISNDFNDDNFDVFDDILEKSIAVIEENLSEQTLPTLSQSNEEDNLKTKKPPRKKCKSNRNGSRLSFKQIPNNLVPSCKADSIIENSIETLDNDVSISEVTVDLVKLNSIEKSQNIYCDICNKSFTRLESLTKHKRTLTHISKLSELEAKEADLKRKCDEFSTMKKMNDVDVSSDSRKELNLLDILDDINESNCKTMSSSLNLNTNSANVKLADLISDVLNKPINKEDNFQNFVIQNDEVMQHEFRKYKSLAERKSFESESCLIKNDSHINNMDYFENDLSNAAAGTILEKQITLLENIIENRSSINYVDETSSPSTHSTGEENSKKDEEIFNGKQNDSIVMYPTYCGKENNSNLNNDEHFLKPLQYDDVSEDSNLRSYDDQKSRKVLNRDEELFLECCSLLKSGSEVSSYSKKSNKLSNELQNGEIKSCDDDWLEKRFMIENDKSFIECYSDSSRMQSPSRDSFSQEDSNSASHWKIDRSTSPKNDESDSQSKKFSFDGVFQNKDDVFKESDSLDKSVPSFEHDVTEVLELDVNSLTNSLEKQRVLEASTQPFEMNEELNNSSIVDGKKVLTKGAMKIFEGLKVSIPTEELNIDNILTARSVEKTSDLNFEPRNFSTKSIAKDSKINKRKSACRNKLLNHKNDAQKSSDVYDFEETQDNSDIFTKPDFRSFRNNNDKFKRVDKVVASDDDSIGCDAVSSGTSSISEGLSTKSKQNLTKKKCMIMGRIFKNAAKSRNIDEDIRSIPAIDNTKLVEDFVLSLSPERVVATVQKQTRMTEEEMNLAFDKLINKSEGNSELKLTENLPSQSKNSSRKKLKVKIKKRTCSESSGDEFKLKKYSKKRPKKKDDSTEDHCINLEQELKECIGVASRKSQRKCTSGKQNILMEYWSSDESCSEIMLEALEKPTFEIKESKASIVAEAKDVSRVFDSETLKKSANKVNRRKRIAVNPLYHWSSSSEDEERDLIEIRPLRDEIDDDEDRPVQHGWIVGDSPKKLVTMLAQAKGKKFDADNVKEHVKKKTSS